MSAPTQYISFSPKPNDTVAMGDGEVAWTTATNLTIVYVSGAPTADDTGGTIDIQVAGSDVITAIDCHLTATPGTWISTALGGTNTPVAVAAAAIVELDFNAYAVGVGCNVVIGFQQGTVND